MTAMQEARTKSGYSVEVVARILDVRPNTVYKWEKGTFIPRGDKLLMLAELYNCEPKELLVEK